MTANNIINNIISFISKYTKELAGRDVIKEIKTYKDPDYGTVIEITLDLDTKEALDLGLKLIKSITCKDCETIINIKWTGENNEIEDYLIEAIYRPKAKEPLDIHEERDKR